MRVEIDQVVLKNVAGTLTASSSATVYVYTRGTTTPVTVYQTETGTSTYTQPLSVSNGRIEGWVESGQSLDLVISDASTTYTQPWEAVSATAAVSVQDEGVALPLRSVLNFTGSGVTASDVGGKTTVAISSGGATFNVMDYGAVGNGDFNSGTAGTDDTAAIQAAINAAVAAGGGVVYLPKCHKVAGNLTIGGDNIHMVGGGDSTGIKFVGTGDCIGNSNPAVNRVQCAFRDFRIDGRQNAAGATTARTASMLTLDNFQYTSCSGMTFWAGGGSGSSHGVRLVGGSAAGKSTYHNFFYACRFRGWNAAVSLESGARAGAWYGGVIDGGSATVGIKAETTTDTVSTMRFFGTHIQPSGNCVELGTTDAAFYARDFEFHGVRVEPGAGSKWIYTNRALYPMIYGGVFAGTCELQDSTAENNASYFLGGEVGTGFPATGVQVYGYSPTAGFTKKALYLKNENAGITVGGDAACNWYRGATGRIMTDANLQVVGKVGFNNVTPLTKPTITGSRGGNAALASLLTALANYGLITDGTTA